MLLEPLSDKKTKVIMIANADPKLNYLPYSLVNMVVRQLAPMMFSLFSSLSAHVEGTEYEKRIQGNENNFYGDIKGRLEQFFYETQLT